MVSLGQREISVHFSHNNDRIENVIFGFDMTWTNSTRFNHFMLHGTEHTGNYGIWLVTRHTTIMLSLCVTPFVPRSAYAHAKLGAFLQ